MNKRLLIILLLTTFGINYAISQKLANNWYFGENAGLSFESGSAVALLDGQLNTREGCASISSEDGDLLFYTDGTQVWNSNHEQMPNGFDLKGNIGSTQSAIIVAKPGNNNLYCIFTIDAVEHENGANGINYSLVNMQLDGGKGDVDATEKNINLTTNLCEKVTSVDHENGEDIWVIAQKWNTNHFYVYLITDQGVEATAIISELGVVIDNLYAAVGYMKISPEGKMLVKANTGLSSVEIFDFDNTNGHVSNARTIPDFASRPYGIEFSPNGKLLYVNAENNSDESLFQFDLEAGSIEDIIASKYVVASQQTSGALQLGPDNKLYVGQNGATALSTVNNPNKSGHACNFEYESIDLGSREIKLGLPTFVQSYFAAISADFYFEHICFGDPTFFFNSSSQEPDSVLWNFGDLPSGTENISKISDPSHVFTDTGEFDVLLTVWKEEEESSKTISVEINHKPIASAGPDKTIPSGTSTILEGEVSDGVGPYTYYWIPENYLIQNNILNPETVILTSPQTFTLYTHDSKGCAPESFPIVLISVTTGETLEVSASISMDSICQGETVNISAIALGGSGLYEYLWTSIPEGFSSNEESFDVIPDESLMFIVNLKDSFNTTVKDSVNVTVKQTPIVNIIPDGIVVTPPNNIVVCVEDTIVLDAGSDLNPNETTYNWNTTNENHRYLTAISNGVWIEVQKHSVEVTIDKTNCSASDSITIVFDFDECAIGVKENLDENSEIKIYPNPNSGIFNLSLNADLKDFKLRIIDVNGKEVFTKIFKGNYFKGEEVDMNINFPEKGVYFFVFHSNKRQFVKKVVIQ